MANQLKTQLQKIPASLRNFLIKAIILFISWQLLYHFAMQPTRVPDRFLTNITGIATEKFYALFYQNMSIQLDVFKVIIMRNGEKVIGIADPCNALEIYVLYVSFIICYPSTIKHRLKYIAIGLPILFVFNVLRACGLTWLNINRKDLADFSHHYLFQAIMYVIVFIIWVRFTRKEHDEHGA